MSADADQAGAEPGERLQKYLARSGVASRRRAETLMRDGYVSVNGAVVRELGARINPAHDVVRVSGIRVAPPVRLRYLIMNKPGGYVTTAHDPHGRRTVLELLPARWRDERVYPVGRLDHNTEGLLLLTNDGDLALRLTHPRYALAKEYHALVQGRPSPEDLAHLEEGMLLPGETRPTAPARAWVLRPGDGGATWVALELHEGRNRQARRMFDAIGRPVSLLIRVRVGPLTLGDLAVGETRELISREVETLRRYVGLSPQPDRRQERSD
ncbi:MAG TPA: pseudouridine synthase [Ktedonobacterales bacterium]